MQKQNLKNATREEKKSAIEELLKKYPNISRREISDLTGIPPSTVWIYVQEIKGNTKSHFETEKELENYIRAHPLKVFGEEIRWIDSLKNLTGESGHDVVADLVGEDTNNKIVVVEVKLLQPNSGRKYDRARESVGQVLHYAYAYIYDLLNSMQREVPIDPPDAGLRLISENCIRLFIVGEEFSQPVENICRLLRAYDINIHHLSIE